MNMYVENSLRILKDITFQLSIAKYPSQRETLIVNLQRSVKALERLLNKEEITE